MDQKLKDLFAKNQGYISLASIQAQLKVPFSKARTLLFEYCRNNYSDSIEGLKVFVIQTILKEETGGYAIQKRSLGEEEEQQSKIVEAYVESIANLSISDEEILEKELGFESQIIDMCSSKVLTPAISLPPIEDNDVTMVDQSKNHSKLCNAPQQTKPGQKQQQGMLSFKKGCGAPAPKNVKSKTEASGESVDKIIHQQPAHVKAFTNTPAVPGPPKTSVVIPGSGNYNRGGYGQWRGRGGYGGRGGYYGGNNYNGGGGGGASVKITSNPGSAKKK